MTIKVDLQQGSVLLDKRAEAHILNSEGEIIAMVFAEIEMQKGADGGMYPAVKLTRLP